jgi:flagellar L-ring protein precursor FlgH
MPHTRPTRVSTEYRLYFRHFVAVFALFFAAPLFAQSGAVDGTSSLLTPSGRAVKMTEASTTFQAPPRQRVFKEEDIIYVQVKQKFSVSSTANNQRKRKIESKTGVTGWTKLSSFFSSPFSLPLLATGGDDVLPELGTKIDSKTQNTGRLTREETLDFLIACRVTDVRDNGNLVIEGTQTSSIGEEGSIITVSGIVRPDTIGPDYKVTSNQVAEFNIQNIPSGNVYDTVRRPWGTRLIEHLRPF